MANITLNKALTKKNSLAGKIKKIQNQIEESNSYNTAQPVHFDAIKLYEELHVLVNDLIRLKTSIENANGPIRSKIFRLAEIKGEIVFLDGIPIKEGEFRRDTYGASSTVIDIYECAINQLKISKRIAELEQEIELLQDEISTFNYTTQIEF